MKDQSSWLGARLPLVRHFDGPASAPLVLQCSASPLHSSSCREKQFVSWSAMPVLCATFLPGSHEGCQEAEKSAYRPALRPAPALLCIGGLAFPQCAATRCW